MSTNTKSPSYNPKYNSFNNEFLSFIFKDDAKGSVFENKPHFYGLIEYTKHNVLVLGCTELMTWIATALARNNAVTYITHEVNLYEKFIKTVNDFNFGGDDIGILCKDEKDYINKLSELKDMKFDKVIMNPPYGNLPSKIITTCIKSSNEIIALYPVSDVETRKFKMKKRLPEVYKHCTKIEYLKDNLFDANIGIGLGIYKFKADYNNPNYEDLCFSKYNKIEMSIFNKLCRYPISLDNQILHLNSKTKQNIDKSMLYMQLPILRGHIIDGKKSWDWTTIYSEREYKFKLDLLITEPYKELHLIPCKSDGDRERLKKFLDSDVLGYALLQIKKNMMLQRGELDYIPFDESLDEAVLIKKLNLTDEELAYIHEKMKNFGYKAKKC